MSPEEKQSRLEKLMQTQIDAVNDAGLSKLLEAEFWDTLEAPVQELLTMDQLIERYGHILTEEQIEKLKTFMKPC